MPLISTLRSLRPLRFKILLHSLHKKSMGLPDSEIAERLEGF